MIAFYDKQLLSISRVYRQTTCKDQRFIGIAAPGFDVQREVSIWLGTSNQSTCSLSTPLPSLTLVATWQVSVPRPSVAQ